MFKRLIIAVLALGFTLGLSGTAFSDVDKSIQPGNEHNPINVNHARYTQLKKARNFTMPNGRIDGTNLFNEVPNGSNSAVHAPSIGCGFTGYHNGSLAYFWTLPNDLGGVLQDLPAVRFTTAAGERCTLKTGSVLIYGPGGVGNPGMRVYLYDDDGFGFPGAKLDSVDFPQGSLPNAGIYWADADFSAAGWVFEDGEEYHIAASLISDSPDDTLAYLSDDATGHAPASPLRNNVYLDGAGFDFWTAVADVYVGDPDFGWFIESETCCAEIPFSDCYSQNYNGAAFYIWAAPHAIFGDSAYAMRFSVSGPETLSSVDFAVFASGSPGGSKGSAYVAGNNDIHVTVYDDDGFGLPGTMLAQVIIPASSYPFFPSYTNAVFAPLVLTGDFHVALATNAVAGFDSEIFLSDNGSSAAGRGSSAWVPGAPVWADMLTGWGLDAAFLITANLCKDEFSNCSITTPFVGLSHVYPVPETVNGNTRWGQRFTAVGANCEIKNVQLTFAWSSADGARAAKMYTDNTDIQVWTDVAGLPGAPLATITLTPADYAAFGNVGFTGSTYLFTGTINFDPLNVQLTGDYWLVVAPQTAVRDSGIRIGLALTAGGAGYVGSGATFSTVFGNTWYVIDDFFGGVLADAAVSFVSEHCCIPFSERACSGTSDWPRAFGNNGSTGTSEVSLGDSWCDLNRIWDYDEFHASAATVSGQAPTIYEGKVVSNFYDRYRKFDLATGTLEYTWGPGATGITGFSLGAQLTGNGTVATVGGTEMLFLGGGTNNNLIAVDWNAPATTLWGITTGPNHGPIRGGAFIVLNQAGTDILYYATNSGNVVARVASTGAMWGGWGTNPVSISGNTAEVVGATDGTDLYFATQPAAPNHGSVYSVDAATGVINWSLAAVDLKWATVYPASGALREVFSAGVSVSGGSVYANSNIAVTLGSQFPADGIYYSLNANTGAIQGYAQSERAFRMAPIVDQNRVMVACLSNWAPASLGATVIAFSRTFSTLDWVYLNPEGVGCRAAALSCEPLGEPDQLYVTAINGWLNVVNADNGDEIYRRRWDALGAGTDNTPKGVSIGNGPYVALSTRNQYLVALTKGADRPRMEFQSYNFVAPVDFGTNPALTVNFGVCLTNTGCAALDLGTVTVDENPFIPRLPTFSVPQSGDAQAMTRAGNIANLLTTNSFANAKGIQMDVPTEFAAGMSIATRGEGRDNRNRAASAVPPWLVSVTHPASTDLVAPGDSLDLEIVVDQNLISRGPQSAYVQVASNDPDFFLNDPAALPQFKMTLVGGCLSDTTGLEFGVGAANLQMVWNMGRLGDGDDTPSHGFDIDGANTVYFQGSYVYAVSQRRFAVNTPEWFSNVDDELISLQADPNWCDTTCKPFLTSPYNVGAISANGITYTPIDANMICRSYIDSVQDFDDGGGGWDVTQYSAAPFSADSSFGIYVRSRVIGAVDEPQLANVTVDLMTITERNGNAVPGLFFGSMNDIDLGGGDTVGMDQSISAAYSWRKTGANGIWGQIKLPFGCGQDPVRNTRGLGGSEGFFAGGGVGLNAYFDSAYGFMQAPSGSITSQSAPNGSDFEQHITFSSHNLAGNQTVELGVAIFGFPNLSNATTTTTSAPQAVKDMSRLVNKWTGWGRGDVNNDNVINLGDIIYLAANVHFAGPGPIPFAHLGDVDASGGAANTADVTYLINFYFNCGPCPAGDFVF